MDGTGLDVLRASDSGPVRLLELNRPEAHNALNRRLVERIAEELDLVEADSRVRAVVFAAAGERAFCAGADLDELHGLDARAARTVLAAGQLVFERIERLLVPTLAAVNGVALGGGFELALACSFIVAGRRASFGLPETGLGLIPGYGGTQRLSRVAGLHVARRLILTGERVGAERAWQLGICSEPPVADEELRRHVGELAAGIGRRGPLATGLALKALAVNAVDASLLDRETELAAAAAGSAEASEGVAAFREKRTPSFPDAAR